MSLSGATKKRIARLKTALEAHQGKQNLSPAEAAHVRLAITYTTKLIQAEKAA